MLNNERLDKLIEELNCDRASPILVYQARKVLQKQAERIAELEQGAGAEAREVDRCHKRIAELEELSKSMQRQRDFAMDALKAAAAGPDATREFIRERQEIPDAE